MHPFREAIVFFGALLVASCGYVGEPLPPALMIPVAVENLAAVERGDSILITATLPELTREGLVLERLGEVELRIGATPEPWDEPAWLAGTTDVETPPDPEPGPLRVETPAARWAGEEVVIAVRVSSTRGRWSDWSNLVALTVTEPLPEPRNIAAVAVGDGIRITWESPDERSGFRYRIYRVPEDSPALFLLGETGQSEWTDAGTQYGETYEYQVQALLTAGDDVAESEPASPVRITPEDRFPPPVPQGLTAIAGLDTIELTWEPSVETGAVTYRLYRAADGEELARIAADLVAPSYSDAEVSSGILYRYTVSAVDALGNESARSPSVEQPAP